MACFGKRTHAVRRAQIVRIAAVAASPDHPEIAIRAARRVGLPGRRIGAVPILAPFLDVAECVVESPRIRRRLAYRHRYFVLWTAEVRAAGVLEKCGGQRVSGPEQLGGAGARGVLPFGLRRQTVRQAFLFRQPVAERFRVVPTHEHDGFVVLFRKTVLAAQRAMRRIELLILRVGYLEHARVKCVADAHPVHGFLVVVAVTEPFRGDMKPARVSLGKSSYQFRPRRVGERSDQVVRNGVALAHEKAARFHPHELHAEGVGEFAAFGSRGGGERRESQHRSAHEILLPAWIGVSRTPLRLVQVFQMARWTSDLARE